MARRLKAIVIRSLRYVYATVAIECLCSAFGFERHAVYPNPDGTIAHAQLSFGNGMIMLGSVSGKDSEWGRLIRQPDEVDGLETQSAYLIVSDADAVYAKAKAAGAEILLDIKDEPHSAFAPVSRTTLAHFTSSLFT